MDEAKLKAILEKPWDEKTSFEQEMTLRHQKAEEGGRILVSSVKIAAVLVVGFFSLILITAVIAGLSRKPAGPLQLTNVPREAALRQLDRSAFEGAPEVACLDRRPTDAAIGHLARAGMRSDLEVLRVATRPVQFRRGSGYVAGAEVRWRPGDPGVRLKRVDYFLIDEDCRAIVWQIGEEKRE